MIVIRGEAKVQAEFGPDWPDMQGELYEVREREELKRLDGVEDTSAEFMDYFQAPYDTDKRVEDLIKASVLGGVMSFEFNEEDGKLYTVTRYHNTRRITTAEEWALIEYTQGQWSDGIGEGFEQRPVRGGYYISAWSGPDQEVTLAYEE